MMFKIEFSIERCNANSQHTCRFLARPLIELQGHLNVFSLLIADKIVQMLADLPFDFRGRGGAGGFPQDLRRQILSSDATTFAERTGSFDGIFKLTNISGPPVPDQVIHGSYVDLLLLGPGQRSILSQEVVH
jgi:hypothetical protein